jgi:hypothetical protein
MLPLSETESSGTCQLLTRPGFVELPNGMRTESSEDCGAAPILSEPRSWTLSGSVRVRVLCLTAWLLVSSYSGFDASSGEYADV